MFYMFFMSNHCGCVQINDDDDDDVCRLLIIVSAQLYQPQSGHLLMEFSLKNSEIFVVIMHKNYLSK